MTYYTYYINPRTGWCRTFKATWNNDMIDNKRKLENRIFDDFNRAKTAMEHKLERMNVNRLSM